MKVSLNWANKYSNVDIKASGIEEVIKRIGAQLGAIEEVVDVSKKYNDVLVANVVSCIKHPNADKLSLCKIDDGGVTKNIERDDMGLVQVVCGAPNVRQGLTVAWIPPGATVPSTAEDPEPFVLSAKELRGYTSNGMIASPSELAISSDHDGILEIENNENVNPGTSFSNLYDLNDIVIDLENKMFTHRPDCFGILGVTRELAGIQGLSYKSPDWYLDTPRFSETSGLPLNIKVTSKQVPRFMAVAMSDIKVTKSPINIQSDLSRVGIRPINNIVDITNWLMHLTGQPIHAYDYDKLKKLSEDAPTIIARDSIKDESLTLLNDKNITFSNESTIVIATDKSVIGVAGVMGGANTEVDESTKNIILEVATFDMYSIRKTSMLYGLFTDAVTRFNKGQSYLQNDKILNYAMQMVTELSGGCQASNVFDIKTSELSEHSAISLTAEFVNLRLGSNLDLQKMQQILNNVEIKSDIVNDSLIVYPPFWRQDLLIAEDVVEELGRLYGFDKLPIYLPSRVSAVTKKDQMLSFKSLIRGFLASNGANEVLTYNFVHSDLFNKVGQDSSQAFELGNALSPSLQHFRLSITPNLLEKVHPNIKAGYDEFCLFEIGKAHNNRILGDDGLPKELERLALVFTASGKVAKKYNGVAYYQAKVYLESLLNKLGIQPSYVSLKDFKFKEDNQIVTPFYIERSSVVLSSTGEFVGVIGEYNYDVITKLKVSEYSAGFELDTAILNKLKKNLGAYKQISKFPKIEQDITLQTALDINYAKVHKTITDAIKKVSEANISIDLMILDIYKGDSFINYTFRLKIVSYNRTLKTEEANNILNSIADYAAEHIFAKKI